jgi:hypothetical protein
MGNTMAELFFPTAVLFIAAQLIDPAVQAQSIMQHIISPHSGQRHFASSFYEHNTIETGYQHGED